MSARRSFARRLAFATAPFLIAAFGIAAPGQAQQTYPSRTIRLVVPFPPGGPTDVLGRILSVKLGEILGQSVVVENRPGATGIVGSTLVANSPPDGYTLLLGTAATHAINVSAFKALSYDPIRSFAPVALAGSMAFLLFAHPSMPSDANEFIELLRDHPKKYAFGAPGTGASYLATELFLHAADASALYVPYQGSGPVLRDTLAGTVQFMVSSVGVGMPMVKQGKLKALAVMGASRLASAPDVPTLDESGLRDFQAETWNAVFAPAGTPKAIVERLNAAVNAAVRDAAVKELLAKAGIDPISDSSPESTEAAVVREIEKWSKAFKLSGATPQ
jgi:tripartite-type tricarboxylate transporter receptor subunit TctC